MDRYEFREILKTYHSRYEEENRYRDSMLSLLEYFPNCFDRDCLSGHFTGSAWILDQKLSQVLLVHHKKLNRWLQPGGHADGDENLFRVARKEANEETGIQTFLDIQKSIFDLDIHLIPKRKDVSAHYHFDVRILMIADDNEKIMANKESNEVKWVDIDEIAPLSEYNTSIRRMISKTKALNR